MKACRNKAGVTRICSVLLGIRQIIVVVNKMDLADYSEKRFREIEAEYREFLSQLGLEARVFVPASAKQGENIARKSSDK